MSSNIKKHIPLTRNNETKSLHGTGAYDYILHAVVFFWGVNGNELNDVLHQYVSTNV